MKYIWIVFLIGCVGNDVKKNCDDIYRNTYFDNCVADCNYPSDSGFCKRECAKISNEKYCK